MGELGDLLELLHGAHDRVSTFEVEYRDWARQRPSLELALVDPAGGRPTLGWRGGGPWATNTVRTRRIWLARPDRLRVEILEGEALIGLGVRAGPLWWLWDETRGTTSGSLAGDENASPTLPPMLTAPLSAVHRLPATLRLKSAGMGERAGRHVFRAQGWPRRPPAARGDVHYEFEFDAEHGSLLRRAEFDGGERVWEREAQQVVYDCEIDPNCFVFVLPEDRS